MKKDQSLKGSNQTNTSSNEKERNQSGDRRRARDDQAGRIYGSEINRAEVGIMREIVPALDLMVIMELLMGNGFDLERSIDSGLALTASLSAEKGDAILSESHPLLKKFQNPPQIKVPSNNYSMNRGTSKEDFLPPVLYTPPSSSSTSSSTQNRSVGRRLSSNSKKMQQLRGVPMILSQRFLSAPRFRFVVDKHTNTSTDFTIYFRRKSEKLGITIQEQDLEILIHALHVKGPQEPLLALESGIKVGDTLTGINSEFFSPGAEVQDIIDILHLAGKFVALHFTRRHAPEDPASLTQQAPLHKFAHMLIDQTVISKDKAGAVSKAFFGMKDRCLHWDTAFAAQRIENWRLDNSSSTPNGGPSSSTSSRGRTTSAATPDRSPLTADSHTENGKMSADAVHRNASIPPSRHLRPAISVRLIRAEERTDHVVYVIWVTDIYSGAEWFVRRRFREFYEFRDILVSYRAGIGRLDFPPKRLNVAEIGAMVSERLLVLQNFMRLICGLVCCNSMHPSTIRIQLQLQNFLEITDRMDLIMSCEVKPTFMSHKNMVQVFVHSVMQMSVMEKVMSGYIDAFFESTNIDDSKRWTEAEGKRILHGMKDFVDNLEIVLYDAVVSDCWDIMRKYGSPGILSRRNSVSNTQETCSSSSSAPSASTSVSASAEAGAGLSSSASNDSEPKQVAQSMNAELELNTVSNKSPLTSHHDDTTAPVTAVAGEVNGLNGYGSSSHSTAPAASQDTEKESLHAGAVEDDKLILEKELELKREKEKIVEREKEKEREIEKEKEHSQVVQQCSEDEMFIQIRSAVRKQVEIEVVVPCSVRLRIILKRSFSSSEAALRSNILKITHQPQSFFGIPVSQISPSGWEAVVVLMRDIRSRTLPHDRLEALLLTAKEIPLHFQREHASSVEDNVTLGADDFLPIFIYIIARAQIPDMLALSEELQALCDPDKRMSETGYYLATLEASLQHIIEADITSESQALFPDMVKRRTSGDDSSDDEEEKSIISTPNTSRQRDSGHRGR